MTKIVDGQALIDQRLAELLAEGKWMIMSHNDIEDDRSANLSVWFNAIRIWPNGCTDAFVVENLDLARAERTNDCGRVVWRANAGPVANVLEELLQLQAPDERDVPDASQPGPAPVRRSL